MERFKLPKNTRSALTAARMSNLQLQRGTVSLRRAEANSPGVKKKRKEKENLPDEATITRYLLHMKHHDEGKERPLWDAQTQAPPPLTS